MSGGFLVDLTALVQAAEGVNGCIAAISDDKVSGLAGSQASYGNDALGSAVSDFCSRWQIGVQNLTTDANQVASRLAQEGRQCDAQGAAFRGAVLDQSDFEEVDFRRADMSKARFGRGSLSGADLRNADLRECVFGHEILATRLRSTRIAGSRVEGASGTVRGPADVGAQDPQLLDDAELQLWFADHGAPLVQVRQ
jgi:uncharacterized protein YjbI with pentapeptide repeats